MNINTSGYYFCHTGTFPFTTSFCVLAFGIWMCYGLHPCVMFMLVFKYLAGCKSPSPAGKHLGNQCSACRSTSPLSQSNSHPGIVTILKPFLSPLISLSFSYLPHPHKIKDLFPRQKNSAFNSAQEEMTWVRQVASTGWQTRWEHSRKRKVRRTCTRSTSL